MIKVSHINDNSSLALAVRLVLENDEGWVGMCSLLGSPRHAVLGVEFIKSFIDNCSGLIALRVDSSALLELIFLARFEIDLHPFLFREINKGSVILENRGKLIADLCLAANSF